jgi:hypothetical protein
MGEAEELWRIDFVRRRLEDVAPQLPPSLTLLRRILENGHLFGRSRPGWWCRSCG